MTRNSYYLSVITILIGIELFKTYGFRSRVSFTEAIACATWSREHLTKGKASARSEADAEYERNYNKLSLIFKIETKNRVHIRIT